MSRYFTAADFERSALPTGFKPDVYEMIELAALHGWVIHVTGAKSITITSPEVEGKPSKKYHFSTNRRNTIPQNRIKRDIIRLADPTLSAMAQTVAQLPPGSEDANRLIDAMPSFVTGTADTVDDRPVAKPRAPKVARHVVSTTPMLAKAGSKAGSDRGYESETTLERQWSDGLTDYICAHPSCDQGPGGTPWEATSRLSVSRHYANAHSRGKGRAPQPPTFAAEVPGAASYAPQQRRVDALAAYLESLIAGLKEGGALTSEDVARAALTWVHEQSSGGTEHAAEREPKTAEETLNLIRTLLDDGTAGRHQSELDELRQQVVHSSEQIDLLIEEVEMQKARAEAARSTLQTLSELAAEQATQEASAG